jgi:hypothetical protein
MEWFVYSNMFALDAPTRLDFFCSIQLPIFQSFHCPEIVSILLVSLHLTILASHSQLR